VRVISSNRPILGFFTVHSREHRRQIHSLEGQLTLERKKTESLQKVPASEITAFVDEKVRMQRANARLREENTALKEKLDELQAKVQILDGELSGRKGLIYPKS
jgi:predicted RNase H-like nuclease (RuvC/YqgF family)